MTKKDVKQLRRFLKEAKRGKPFMVSELEEVKKIIKKTHPEWIPSTLFDYIALSKEIISENNG